MFDAYHKFLGIPPEEQPPDHYRLLGIARFESDPEVIAGAADRQMAHLRTYQSGKHAADSQRLLNEVAAARVSLLNAEKKAAYDAALRASLTPPTLPGPEPTPLDDLAAVVSQRGPVRAGAKPKSDRPLRRIVTVASAGLAAVAVGLVLWQRSSHDPVAVERPDARDRAASAASRPTERPVQPKGRDEAPAPSKGDPPAGGVHQLPTKEEVGGADQPTPKPAGPAEAHPTSIPSTLAEPVLPSLPELPLSPPEQSEQPNKPPMPSPPPPEPAKPAAEPPKPAPSPSRPEAAADAQLESLLNDAWSTIGRGESVPGEEKLLAARKIDRDEIRAEFSLGLLRALVGHDWATAQKHFEQCFKQQPEHAAVLNNLALVRLRLNKEGLALRHWEAVLAAGPPPDEVAQNLGRVVYLLKTGRMVLKPEMLKTLDGLARRADAAAKFRPQTGFRYMGLQPAGEKTFGWPLSVGYEDRWCVVCDGRGEVRCPVSDCSRGAVREMKTEVVGRDPVTGNAVTRRYAVRVPCKQCKGRGWVDCPACDGGKDPMR